MHTDTERLTANRTCKNIISRLILLCYLRKYNSNGEAVYMTAALGVIMDTNTQAQKFFGGKKVRMTSKFDGDDLEYHRDDIISIDISTDRKTAVTGETG